MISPAKTPAEYINALQEPRKADIVKLDTLIRKTVPQLKAIVGFGMLAYGEYHFRYASGREGDWAVICLASQKNYISLYVSCLTPTGYLAEEYKDKLPKASIGKSCIRFNRFDDLDQPVLVEILKKAAKLGGMSAV